ncbi:hypothetical protein DVA86_26410 [Streptomyces armeniacus]|uniref:Uncharacterized protein n=1 Tax=Streptomyces armeniacus TaxID=83291 RepID=A0A345XVH8_9ACTN|nr:hypothetical protein [Streptomyces armeniacus]AXK35644.1 hypothetical protein DVA86_26410 [Streptomyces armeniacus]
MERSLETYARGVRTALRDNATAYGFSISVTAAYGLAGTGGAPTAFETVCFALAAALAFFLVSLVFLALFRHQRLSEGEQVLTLSGGIDVLSVVAAVCTAYGCSHLPGFAVWPVTGLATVVVYLLAGGLDVVLARATARRTSVGRPSARGER